MAALTDLAAHELGAAIAAGEVSCREVMQAFLDRIAALNPRHNAIVSLRDGDELLLEADRLRPRAGAQRRRRRAAAVPLRPAAGGQGHGADGRHPQHLGLAAVQGLRARRRFAPGAADEGGRLHRHRQDQHAGVRPRLAHLQRGVRRDPQRLRSDPLGRRQQRRRRGRDRDADAARGRRQRLDGKPAQPGGLEQRVRLSPEPGPGAELAGAGRLGQPLRHRRADGEERPRPRPDARRAGRLRRAGAALARHRGRRSPRGSRRAPTRPRRQLRIGWLGDLDGHLAMEDGILDICAAGLSPARGRGLQSSSRPRSALRPSGCGTPGSSGAGGSSTAGSRRTWPSRRTAPGSSPRRSGSTTTAPSSAPRR